MQYLTWINIKDFEFQDLLDPESNLYDVEFKIIDENSQELGTVRSHKFLLSLLSPVLKKMFMSRDEGSIVVEITGSSFISFQTLIQYLYTGDESVITGQLNHRSLVSRYFQLLMICLIFMFRYTLYWWSYWSLCSDVSSIDDMFDLYVQIYPLFMILLIFMFRWILYWWYVWSLCSDVSSIHDLFDHNI